MDPFLPLALTLVALLSTIAAIAGHESRDGFESDAH